MIEKGNYGYFDDWYYKNKDIFGLEKKDFAYSAFYEGMRWYAGQVAELIKLKTEQMIDKISVK